MTPDIRNDETRDTIGRREAIRRVSLLLGGVALVGSGTWLSGCRAEPNTDAPFTTEDIAFLDEVADTILPTTSTPGAKAAKTGAFMATIVTDSYGAAERKAFREGMRKLDDAMQSAHKVSFMAATSEQRLGILRVLDAEQKAEGDVRKEAYLKKSNAILTDERDAGAPRPEVSAATAITAEPPPHYFRMMKELALLGYFTSE
ncbi:MAG: gluconate 2-dehydrogenase subunit 3 family protein, partial [Gemmatimonadaceae bacterium]